MIYRNWTKGNQKKPRNLGKGKGFIFWAVLISAGIDLLATLANLFTGAGADYITIVLEGLTLIACFSLKN